MNLAQSGSVLTRRPIPSSCFENTSVSDGFTEAEWLYEWKMEEDCGENQWLQNKKNTEHAMKMSLRNRGLYKQILNWQS